MVPYGVPRIHPCCPGHTPEFTKGVRRKNRVNKHAVKRKLRKHARQAGKKTCDPSEE